MIRAPLTTPFTTLSQATQALGNHGILLKLTKKSVKNINFRIAFGVLNISHPAGISQDRLAHAIWCKLPWILSAHTKLATAKPTANQPDMLWGKPLDMAMYQRARLMSTTAEPLSVIEHHELLLEVYRFELQRKLPILAKKWQPIVNAYACDIRIKKMRTLWGSCNTKAARIWLSVYLPAYPYACTEYVFVHELCHLHHQGHGKEFWACVKKAMPHYREWHDLLRAKGGSAVD